MNSVIVSGMPASGKTTVAKVIAERYHLKYLCGGDMLKEMAIDRGYKPSGDDWWDSETGMKFLEERKKSDQFDREVDERLVKAVEKGGVSITSYTAPWLANKGVKIWLKASAEARAKRMASRDNMRYTEASEIVKKRDAENSKLYRKMYGFEIDKDLSVFHLVIDTDNLSKESVIEIVEYAAKYFL
ncbi:MAG: cytidylate kinase family protein [Thaumarchaeota archaeon]|nr:cytidylate kinase family protein [Nitrososphaerota archaeon]MCL5318021.1 cytidylate kinase family protein [Nitrososphaerota archaeon]